MKKKILLTTTLNFLIFLMLGPMIYAETSDPKIDSNNAVLLDAYDGTVLFGKKENESVYPASITKVLTALIVDENLEDGALIKASSKAVEQEASNSVFLLEEGETITKEDALHLIMMISSNDVSYALAEEVAGSVDEFAKKMNAKAKELGAKNSHFVNPNGLPNEDHKTSAYDMALIGKEVLNHPNILEAMQEKEYKLKTNKKEVVIKPTHSIFEQNEKAIGGKTGWTMSSGNTLLEFLKDKGETLVAVTMGANGSDVAYDDMNKLATYGFAKIDTVNFFKKDEEVFSSEQDGKEIKLLAKEPIDITKKGRKNIENRIVVNNIKNYQAGDTIGKLEIINNGSVERAFDLYTERNIEIVEEDTENKSVLATKGIKEELPKVFSIIFGIPVVIFVILSGISMVGRKK